MLRSLLEEYDIILARLEKVDWNTHEIIFNLLGIEDKDTLDKLAILSDEELKEVLEMDSAEEITASLKNN